MKGWSPIKLSAEEKKIAVETSQNILMSYSSDRGNMLPVLQQIQARLGYIPDPAMDKVAAYFQVPPVDVYGVVTFYNQFRLTPPGKNQVQVCMGTACHMKGGNIIMDSWERRLEIKCGQTTADREFSLEGVACVGCCTQAPVAVISGEIHARVTPTRVDGLLLSYQLNQGQLDQDKGSKKNE